MGIRKMEIEEEQAKVKYVHRIRMLAHGVRGKERLSAQECCAQSLETNLRGMKEDAEWCPCSLQY